MEKETMVSVKDKIANPSPLGLLGFGFTTILLNIHNAGVTQLSMTILAMGIFYGGLAQVIAGIMEFKKGNTFGATAFTSYGLFWWSLVAIWIGPPADEISMGFYLAGWGFFTLIMFIATLKHNRATQIVFGSLAILFILLSLADFTGIHVIKTIAGIEGILCGASAVYAGLGQILNEEYGRTFWPLG